MVVIVYIIHLIRLAVVCCAWLTRGLGCADPGLVLTVPGVIATGIGTAPGPAPGKATPQKRRSEAISPSPSDAKINKTTGHGILGVMFGFTKKVNGLYLFQILKRKCHLPTGG